jgi:hypothetical protein
MVFIGHITISLDRLHRLHVARCLRCGHLIVAAKQQQFAEVAAASHHCEMKSRTSSAPLTESKKANTSENPVQVQPRLPIDPRRD